MDLAVIGFILMFVLMLILTEDRLSPLIVSIPLPLVATVAGGFEIETISGFVKTGLNTVLSTAVLSISSISYFTLMSNEGPFDPIIRFLIKRAGNNAIIIPFAVVITTFVAHLDGSGAATSLIVVLVFLPICKWLKARPEALLGTMCGMYGVVNIVSQGGPTMHAAPVIRIEVLGLYQFIVPSVAVLAVIAFRIASVIARIEIHNGAGADKDDTTADEKRADEGTVKRKRLYWFNLGLMVLALALLLVDIDLPLYLTFMIALCIALTMNYPDTTEQTKQLRSYAASAMITTMTLFSVGIFTGMIKDSGMMEAMAAAIVGILPAEVTLHMHRFMALFAVPPIMVLGTDAFYYALMLTILGVMEQFGISPEVAAATFLLTATLGTPTSPSMAAVYANLGLADSTIGKHIKYSPCILWPVSIPLLVVSILIGIIRF